jgi:hypothetical protein
VEEEEVDPNDWTSKGFDNKAWLKEGLKLAQNKGKDIVTRFSSAFFSRKSISPRPDKIRFEKAFDMKLNAELLNS